MASSHHHEVRESQTRKGSVLINLPGLGAAPLSRIEPGSTWSSQVSRRGCVGICNGRHKPPSPSTPQARAGSALGVAVSFGVTTDGVPKDSPAGRRSLPSAPPLFPLYPPPAQVHLLSLGQGLPNRHPLRHLLLGLISCYPPLTTLAPRPAQGHRPSA